MEYCLITTTFNDKENADQVVNTLLSEKLVSCVQRFNIVSSYHWNGKIENDDEIYIQMKTKKTLYKEVEKKILELHNYEIPQIVMYDIKDGYLGYLNWIGDETK